MVNNVITQNFTCNRGQCLKLVLEKSLKSHGIFSQKRCMNPALILSVYIIMRFDFPFVRLFGVR